MTKKFRVIFCRVDGLAETDIGSSHGLNADTLDEAHGEAAGMGPPGGANFFKILDEYGSVVKRVGFAL